MATTVATASPLVHRYTLDELWLVDPEEKQIEQRRLTGNKWKVLATARGTRPLESAVFRELVVVPRRVFA